MQENYRMTDTGTMAVLLSEIQRKQWAKKGFYSTKITMDAKETNIKGVLCAAPFFVFLASIYRICLIHRAVLLDSNDPQFLPLLASIVIICAIAHNLLHGAGWAIIGKAGWDSISFRLNGLMPYCSCDLVLRKGSYLIGTVLPAIVLGVFSTVFLAIYPGTVSMLTLLINFLMAGKDCVIALEIMKSNFTLIGNLPTETGFIGYTKQSAA